MTMFSFTRKIALGAALCLLAVPVPAVAQSSDVINRLNRIENELDTLNRVVYRGERPAETVPSARGAAASADTEVRLQQIEREVQQIRGQMEEQGFQLRQISEKLNLMEQDQVLQQGGQNSNYDTPSTPSTALSSSGEPVYVAPEDPQNSSQRALTEDLVNAPPTSGSYTSRQLGTLTQDDAGNVSPNTGSAATEYENAFALLKAGNNAGAEKGFQAFLNKYPDHELTPNALYWLGETYYVRGEFERAARQFAEGYQKYPEGAKASDNLLKLGMSLAGMGNKEDACVALSQLSDSKFRGSPTVQRRAEKEMENMGC